MSADETWVPLVYLTANREPKVYFVPPGKGVKRPSIYTVLEAEDELPRGLVRQLELVGAVSAEELLRRRDLQVTLHTNERMLHVDAEASELDGRRFYVVYTQGDQGGMSPDMLRALGLKPGGKYLALLVELGESTSIERYE